MSFDRLFQIFSLVSVIAGFSLVVWELQQNKDITMALLASDGAVGRSEMRLQEAEHSEVYARACTDHSSLSKEDSLILVAIIETRYDMLVNRLINYERSMRSGIDWQSGARSYFEELFETEFGRKYWEYTRGSYRDDVREIGDSVFVDIGDPECFALTLLDDKEDI